VFRRLAIVVLALGLTACAARANVDMETGAPALVPPTPPARLVVPMAEKPTLPDVEPEVSQPAPTTPNRPRETRPPAPPTPPPTPPATQVGTPPPAVLSTTANTTNFERRIREQLKKAAGDLSQVNPRTLGADARAQYDAAQGFIRQCEEALKVRNLMFASQLADKAATMAALLRR
jgi:WAS/WASL-interacting protein